MSHHSDRCQILWFWAHVYHTMFLLTIIISSILIYLSFGGPIIDPSTYLLPSTVLPIHYTIKIVHLNIKKKTFNGTVIIVINVVQRTKEIIIHQKNLNISKENVKLSLVADSNVFFHIKNASIFGAKYQEFYRVSLNNTLEMGNYTLTIIDYQGSLDNDNIGFYCNSYVEGNKTMIYAATHFQPTFARYAFPCFDEPFHQTVFKIYINRPKGYKSVSYADLRQTKKIDKYHEEDEFEETDAMSTYAIYFIISKLKLSKKIGVCEVLAKPAYINDGLEQNFLQLAHHFVVAFEKFFNTTYYPKKLVHVTIPSFFKVDTHNWGVIAYEESIFVQLNNTLNNINQYFTISLAHKICHQWFGGLIPLKWWNYTWLNEGICVYSTFKVVNDLNPDWNVTENLLTYEINYVMHYDYLNYIKPLTHDVETAEEILDAFNLISYSKGAAIIRMLEAITNPTNFLRGMANFTKVKAFCAVEPLDLYEAMQDSLDENAMKSFQNLTIPEVMSTWDSKSGYPLVNVKRNYDDNNYNAEMVTFTQQKFCYTCRNSKLIWSIPINYATKNYPNFKNTAPAHWLINEKQIIRINELQNDKWLIINNLQAYYYRVNYDPNNWMMIIKALKGNLNSIALLNRIQLIQDSYAIASIGLINLKIPFQISETFRKENEYSAIHALRITIERMQKRVSGTIAEKLLNDFTATIVYAIYTHHDMENYVHTDKNILISELTFSWLSQLNHPKIIAYSKISFNSLTMGLLLPKHLEKHIMCSVVKNSNDKLWEFLFDKYKSSHNPELRRSIFYALGCTDNVNLLKRYLQHSDEKEYGNTLSALQSIMATGSEGLDIVLKYILSKFNDLYSKFGKSNMNDILMNIGSRITTPSQLGRLRELVNAHPAGGRLLDLAIEKAQENIQWNKAHLDEVIQYLNNNHRGTTLSCLYLSTLLLIGVTLLF